MRRIRVLIANGPTLLREAVRATICGQSDIEVVGEAFDEESLADEIERAKPDYLIISMDSHARRALCGFLLGQFPAMRILALNSDGSGAQHYWAQIMLKTEQVVASPDVILGMMRRHNDFVSTPVLTATSDV